MAMQLDGAAFKLPINVNRSGKMIEVLKTENTFIDKNIVIDVEVPEGSVILENENEDYSAPEVKVSADIIDSNSLNGSSAAFIPPAEGDYITIASTGRRTAYGSLSLNEKCTIEEGYVSDDADKSITYSKDNIGCTLIADNKRYIPIYDGKMLANKIVYGIPAEGLSKSYGYSYVEGISAIPGGQLLYTNKTRPLNLLFSNLTEETLNFSINNVSFSCKNWITMDKLISLINEKTQEIQLVMEFDNSSKRIILTSQSYYNMQSIEVNDITGNLMDKLGFIETDYMNNPPTQSTVPTEPGSSLDGTVSIVQCCPKANLIPDEDNMIKFKVGNNVFEYNLNNQTYTLEDIAGDINGATYEGFSRNIRMTVGDNLLLIPRSMADRYTVEDINGHFFEILFDLQGE